MAVRGANTGIKITTQSGYVQDLAERYVSKDYLIDVYPNLLPNRYSPGLYFAGQGTYGQNGQNTTTQYSTPVLIGAGSSEWEQAATGFYHQAAVKKDGTLWTWGANSVGQLGTGDTTYYSSPVQVGSLTNWKQVTCGTNFTIAIKDDGTMWSWGLASTYYQTGQNTTTNTSSPVQIGSSVTWSFVSAGDSHSLALANTGQLYGIGRGNNGQITGFSTALVPTAKGYYYKTVQGGAYHSLLLSANGTLYTTGFNDQGQLGDNTIVDKTTPVQLSGTYISIAAGAYHSVGVRSDGTLWAWGRNNEGQLGLGDRTNRSVPTQVGTLTNWKKVTGGNLFTQALKTDGTMWGWGDNGVGELGIGNITKYSSPIQVGSLTTWKSLSMNCVGFTSLTIRDAQE